MRIYLDTCCYNRPFDDPANERVRIEIAAIQIIMARVGSGEWKLIGGDALSSEIMQNEDFERRRGALLLLSRAAEWVELSSDVLELGSKFESCGVRGMDSLHLASATKAGADVFLTVDSRLYRRARKLQNPRPVATMLPAEWLESLTGELGK